MSRWYASSKTCRACGQKNKELSLSDRTFICPTCGNIIDRDFQAALNILGEGLRMLAEGRSAA